MRIASAGKLIDNFHTKKLICFRTEPATGIKFPLLVLFLVYLMALFALR